jgi:copper transport protein
LARAARIAGLAALLLFGARRLAVAHATLLSSDPAAGAVLATSPSRIRLVFSEPIDASVSAMKLVGANDTVTLVVTRDPRDVHALIGTTPALAEGGYLVEWRTVSADGHRIAGKLEFSVGPAAVAMPEVDTAAAPAAAGEMSSMPTVDPVAATLRGLAVGSLMAFVGALVFLAPGPQGGARRRVVTVAAWSALAMTVAYVVAWIASIGGDHPLSGSAIGAALGTAPGKLEVARLAAIALALWALLLARRHRLALLFGGLALIVSGATGHAGVEHAAIAVPAKAIHLLAGATWLGALLWYLTAPTATDFARWARRVSNGALGAVVVIVLTGVAQTALLLAAPGDLFSTTYGRIILLKVTGVLVLVAFGAFHRYRILPAGGDDAPHRLARSVSREIAVFAIVTLAGGWLASVSPRHAPPEQPTPASVTTHQESLP